MQASTDFEASEAPSAPLSSLLAPDSVRSENSIPETCTLIWILSEKNSNILLKGKVATGVESGCSLLHRTEEALTYCLTINSQMLPEILIHFVHCS